MKLTREKLAIYKKYRGNVDIWDRVASREEREEMANTEWSELGLLFHQVENLEKGQLSDEFAARVRNRLQELAPDLDLQKEIIAIALTGI